MDYQLTSINKLLQIPVANAPNMFTRNFVIELYPGHGYASIGVGTGDLLSVISAMNEKGLIAVLHTDNYTMINTDPKPDYSGLVFPTQMLRYILDTFSTVEEAKIAVLNNKLSLTFEPAHLLIADVLGNVVCVEINPKNARIELTEKRGEPQVFTNHPIYLFPDPKTFPHYTAFEQDNTFSRFQTLLDAVNKKKQFSFYEVVDNQSQVVARWNNPGRGQYVPLPNRTIWTDVFDQKTGTVKVRFYLKDGPINPETGDPETLVFSDFFTFSLQK